MKDSNVRYTDTGYKSFTNGTQRFVEQQRMYSNNFTQNARTPVYSPLSLPGLSGWYDASDAASVTLVANKVSVLADKNIGGAAPLTQTTDANRFTYVIAAQNGLNVLEGFAGLNANMQNNGAIWGLVSSGYYIFAVAGGNTGTGNTSLLGANFSSQVTLFWLGTTIFTTHPSGSSVGLDITIPAGNDNSIHLTSVINNGLNTTIGYDSLATTVATNLQDFSNGVGQYNLNPNGFIGRLGELIVGRANLTSPQILAVTSYLKAKWNTP